MSEILNEKLRSGVLYDSTSQDDDSGHDSVDDVSTPADERDRIASLEVAVAWIREEVIQLKSYDQDILQELMRTRNVIRTLRDAHRSNHDKEKRFLDDTIEDRSPTPEDGSKGGGDQEDSVSPSSMSPLAQYLGPDGNMYSEDTIRIMSTAPSHLKQETDEDIFNDIFGADAGTAAEEEQEQTKSTSTLREITEQEQEITERKREIATTNTAAATTTEQEQEITEQKPREITTITEQPSEDDDKVLEDFFGKSELNRLFKSQFSINSSGDDKMENGRQANGGGSRDNWRRGGGGEGHLMQGVSMPNISSIPSGSDNNNNKQQQQQQQVKLRLAKKLSAGQSQYRAPGDANRISYDVASEMEALRTRLQETAKQQLAEFDRKYSPKFSHASITGSGSHSREGSFDNSTPQHSSSGHIRQYSLPIDQNQVKALQKMTKSEANNVSQQQQHQQQLPWSTQLSKSTNHLEHAPRSPTPPLLYGHIRQISAGSMSSESGTFSPPPTPGQLQDQQQQQQQQQQPTSFHHMTTSSSASSVGSRTGNGGIGGMPSQQFKLSKAPGMSRISSDGSSGGSSNSQSFYPHSSSSSAVHNRTSSENISISRTTSSGGEVGVNGASTNNGIRARSSSSGTHQKPHYSTAVLKKGKRKSQDLSSYPAAVPSGSSSSSSSSQQMGTGKGLYSYEDMLRMKNGVPSAYEQPKPRNPEDGSHRPTTISPPRLEGTIPASPKMSRSDRSSGGSNQSSKLVQQQQQQQQRTSSSSDQKASHPDDIQPYMSSSHVRAQMAQMGGFNYTPYSSSYQQRSNTVSGADAPRLSKQRGSTSSSGSKGKEHTWL